MKSWQLWTLVGLAVIFGSASSRAEVNVVSERNQGAAATGAFKLQSVPSPSRTDAANKAKLTIVGGRIDPNGGDLEVLIDGKAPSDEDQPAASFFFAPNTEGGRLLMDLNEEIEIRQVNTYSWHTNTRAPQVYKLYGGGAALADSITRLEAGADLAMAGWKHIAAVDTRPKEGEPGGQYGVSIAESRGSLGKYRYILLEVSCTEPGTPFSNTFFSEIDVNDGKEYPPPPDPKPLPLDVVKVADKYEIAFDLSQTPELKDWVDTRLKPVCVKWYPMIVEMLPSDGYTAPDRFTIVFHKDMRGVANASGRRINCAAPWFKRNLEGEAVGAVVHEMVHIVQQYRRSRGGNRNPGWMVEGLADYIRWFLYEPEDKRPRPNPARANYDDSYRTTGAFLAYVKENHDKEVIKKFNATMREGKYSDSLWKEYTGKTAPELWADYIKTLTQ